MKRDMNLVRLLLLEVEGADPKPDLKSYSEEQQVYHLALLIEAKLVDGAIVPNYAGYPVAASAIRLTWQGHEFLDAARNENVWKRTVEKVRSVGGGVSLEVMKTLLLKTANELLGL